MATAAVREADNKSAFLRRLRQEAGLEVRVVSGMEEARLIYLGVSSGVHLGEKTALFIDIGGGSTEIAVGNQQQHHWLASLKLGAIRVSSLFVADPAAPVSPEQYALIQRNVRVAAVRTIQQVRRYRIDLALGSSGTIENLADIAARMFIRRKRERDGTLTHEQLKQVIQVLCDLLLDKRRKVSGINPERADIIIGGAAVLDTLMQELQDSVDPIFTSAALPVRQSDGHNHTIAPVPAGSTWRTVSVETAGHPTRAALGVERVMPSVACPRTHKPVACDCLP